MADPQNSASQAGQCVYESTQGYTVDNISSSLCLFGNDYLLYRVIQSETDIANLQSDLNGLAQYMSHIWQMKFNIDKCIVIKYYRAQAIIPST